MNKVDSDKDEGLLENFKEKYLNALGLPKLGGDTSQSKKDALNRAHTLRTLEIELYWKRATYFWGYQLAIFAAFGLVLKDGFDTKFGTILLLISGLGVITALSNSFSARGSKFWQQNWENHIDMLEDDFEGRLYKIVWLAKRNRPFSVTKINTKINDIFVLFWFSIFLYTVFHVSQFKAFESIMFESENRKFLSFLFPIIILIILGMYLGKSRSNLTGSLPSADGSHAKKIDWSVDAGQPIGRQFVRRFAPGEGDE